MPNAQSWIGWGLYVAAKFAVKFIPVEEVRKAADSVVDWLGKEVGPKIPGADQMPLLPPTT
jgi:hypothetical protein